LHCSLAVEVIATELDQGQNADIFNFTSHVYVLCKNRVRIGGFVHAPASLKVVISTPRESAVKNLRLISTACYQLNTELNDEQKEVRCPKKFNISLFQSSFHVLSLTFYEKKFHDID
jgi:hypothetical protein